MNADRLLDTRPFRAEVAAWHHQMYPAATPDDLLHKLAEEVGELCGAWQKAKWSTDPTNLARRAADERDAIGDILVVLAAYCDRRGIDLDAETERTWRMVSTRSQERVLNGRRSVDE